MSLIRIICRIPSKMVGFASLFGGGAAATDFLFEDSDAYLFEDSVQFEFEDAPTVSSYYLRPGGVDYYRRPGGVDRYLRP